MYGLDWDVFFPFSRENAVDPCGNQKSWKKAQAKLNQTKPQGFPLFTRSNSQRAASPSSGTFLSIPAWVGNENVEEKTERLLIPLFPLLTTYYFLPLPLQLYLFMCRLGPPSLFHSIRILNPPQNFSLQISLSTRLKHVGWDGKKGGWEWEDEKKSFLFPPNLPSTFMHNVVVWSGLVWSRLGLIQCPLAIYSVKFLHKTQK